MKTGRRRLIALLLALPLAPLVGCDDEEDGEEEEKSTRDKLESDDAEKRKEGVKEAREKYDDK